MSHADLVKQIRLELGPVVDIRTDQSSIIRVYHQGRFCGIEEVGDSYKLVCIDPALKKPPFEDELAVKISSFSDTIYFAVKFLTGLYTERINRHGFPNKKN